MVQIAKVGMISAPYSTHYAFAYFFDKHLEIPIICYNFV